MRPILIGAMLAALIGAAGAMAAPAPKAYHPAHNRYGQPDFEGVWSLNSMTRLERPAGFPNLVLSEEEAKRPPPSILPNDSVGTADTESYDSFNLGWARVGNEIRSSWLIEPANGRLPYSAAGEAKMRATPTNNDNPEGRSNYERCISLPQSGPPMLNAAYNNNVTILQTRDQVVLLLEGNHEARIVRLAAKSHPPGVSQWFGDSIGHYDGETLVVETTGFSPGQSDRRNAMSRVFMSPAAKVTERFTRISARQIRYEFSVDDPAMFTQVWKGEIPLTFTTEKTYEYACHEGNYGLENILSGARYEEEHPPKARQASRPPAAASPSP